MSRGDRREEIFRDNLGDKRLQEILNRTSTGALLSQFDYTYDDEAQILTWTKNYPGLTPAPQRYDLTYDNADQLTQAPLKNANNNTIITNYLYAYDLASNRRREKIGTVTTDSTLNNVNEIISQSGGTNRTLTYDANGNPTNDGTRSFEWDAANRLTAINNSTLRTEFSYNGLNQRVKLVEKDNGAVTMTRNFVWVGSELCETRNASNTVQRRYYPHGMQVGATNYFYTRDHLGSVRELTDGTGAVVTRYDYDPYGRRTTVSGGTTNADFGFTGHYYHSRSDLHLAQYRAYSADLGRWISRDPLGEQSFETTRAQKTASTSPAEVTQGTNLYAYVRNQPVSLIDPLGLEMPTWESKCSDSGSPCPPGEHLAIDWDCVDRTWLTLNGGRAGFAAEAGIAVGRHNLGGEPRCRRWPCRFGWQRSRGLGRWHCAWSHARVHRVCIRLTLCTILFQPFSFWAESAFSPTGSVSMALRPSRWSSWRSTCFTRFHSCYDCGKGPHPRRTRTDASRSSRASMACPVLTRKFVGGGMQKCEFRDASDVAA